jgi:hypothetical protein
MAPGIQEIAQARAEQAQRHMWLGGGALVPPPRPPPPRPPPGEPTAPVHPAAVSAAAAAAAVTPAGQARPPPWPPAAYQLSPPPPASSAVVKTEAAHEAIGAVPSTTRALAPASLSDYSRPVSVPVFQTVKAEPELPAAATHERGPCELQLAQGDDCGAVTSEQVQSTLHSASVVQPPSSLAFHAVAAPESAAETAVKES